MLELGDRNETRGGKLAKSEKGPAWQSRLADVRKKGLAGEEKSAAAWWPLREDGRALGLGLSCHWGLLVLGSYWAFIWGCNGGIGLEKKS